MASPNSQTVVKLITANQQLQLNPTLNELKSQEKNLKKKILDEEAYTEVWNAIVLIIYVTVFPLNMLSAKGERWKNSDLRRVWTNFMKLKIFERANQKSC